MYIGERELNFIKKIDLRIILEYYNRGSRDGEWFLCPSKNHKDHKPSCKYYEESNTITCFVCVDDNGKRKNWDIFKLYAEINDLDNKKDFHKICCELTYLINDILDSKEVIRLIEDNNIYNKKQKEDKDYLKDIEIRINNSKTISQLHKEKKFFLDVYLNKRCIDYKKIKEILELNNIEIRHNYYNNINSILININNKLILQRQIEDYLKDDKNADNKKFNIGKTDISIIKGDIQAKNLIIFEGIYDLLSFMSNCNSDPRNYTYVCLNSVNNTKKLFDYIENNLEEFEFIEKVLILTDDDEPGRQCNKKIKEYFDDLDIQAFSTSYEGYKDFNDYIINKKKVL